MLFVVQGCAKSIPGSLVLRSSLLHVPPIFLGSRINECIHILKVTWFYTTFMLNVIIYLVRWIDRRHYHRDPILGAKVTRDGHKHVCTWIYPLEAHSMRSFQSQTQQSEDILLCFCDCGHCWRTWMAGVILWLWSLLKNLNGRSDDWLSKRRAFSDYSSRRWCTQKLVFFLARAKYGTCHLLPGQNILTEKNPHTISYMSFVLRWAGINSCQHHVSNDDVSNQSHRDSSHRIPSKNDNV
jgi:hypothetical protein